MDKSTKILSDLISECPVCKFGRVYKTKQGFLKGINKPCKSCSNSLSRGGNGSKYKGDKIHCSKCKTYLSKENFYFRSNKPYSYCKACHVLSSSTYYKETEKFSRYKITKDKYETILKNQQGKCGGCSIEMIKPYIDHCHKSGKVRGLLCQACNSALGLLKDNCETLRNLINYLKEGK